MGSINLGTNGTITNLSSASGAYDNDLKSDIALLGFYRAADNSKTKYNLTNQVIDEFNDSTGVDAGNSTNQNVSGGAISGAGNNYPTGGTVTTYTGYRVHSFTSTGNTNFVVPASGTVDALIVGGGGGGGGYGGGGAGGFRTSASAGVTAQTYTITVGAGGVNHNSVSSDKRGASGSDSSALGVTSTGGGGGGGNSADDQEGRNGGSGGGGGTDHAGALAGGSGNTPSTSPSQGNNGGTGATSHPSYTGGGGGGAGGAGGAVTTTYTGGVGGVGAQNLYRTGSNQYYAGGGGGGGSQSGGTGGTGGAGGSSVGGNGGGVNNSSSNPTAPVANTGSGGGAEDSANATDGAAGIVVIRYADTEFATVGNMTLVSTAQTASSAPSTADFHALIENATGTATINTDIKAYVSRDNGSNWTELTLVDEGTWGTNRKVLAAHDASITSASGTSVRYKITTHNQSLGSKKTKVYATSVGWK